MSSKDDFIEKSIWSSYYEKGSDFEHRIIEFYLPYSRSLAHKFWALFSNNPSDLDEFRQNANLGLIDAIRKFDDTMGASFKTYAFIRIKGSILNGIKSISEACNYNHFHKNASVERSKSLLIMDEAEPSSQELSEAIILLAYSYILDDLHVDELVDTSSDPYNSCMIYSLRKRLKGLLIHLNEEEKTILELHYFNHISFTEISNLLSLSKGRVSQLHKQALQKLRFLLSN